MSRPNGKHGWMYRRILIFYVVGLCSGLLVHLTLHGNDGTLHMLIAEGAWWTLVMILAMYVFGASFEDLASLKMGVFGSNRRTTDKKADE